ncbi:hypothetical protein BVRB_5g125730 [Beta vulgaris subsp. vulgaris]|uniref:DUF740 family protein n=1 Tax=Beta vulgaris subsp. vulgaris TaxID=3555 RepID=A0A0J8B8K9_BETVV|nr:hypothetical protein BVRB_5g125730 [Beta vulgaris subsp. vulgaris]
MDYAEIWKCSQHPTKRRRIGVCPLCLKERLDALCPECANVRPCSCYATTSSSSSSSSSFSLHISEIGRSSTLTNGQPAFRRSRSSAFPFFRSVRFSAVEDETPPEKAAGKSVTSSFWSVIWWQKKPRREKMEPEMRRSRSVAVVDSDVRSMKAKGWYFPSPMKLFRQSNSKTSKFFHKK